MRLRKKRRKQGRAIIERRRWPRWTEKIEKSSGRRKCERRRGKKESEIEKKGRQREKGGGRWRLLEREHFKNLAKEIEDGEFRERNSA